MQKFFWNLVDWHKNLAQRMLGSCIDRLDSTRKHFAVLHHAGFFKTRDFVSDAEFLRRLIRVFADGEVLGSESFVWLDGEGSRLDSCMEELVFQIPFWSVMFSVNVYASATLWHAVIGSIHHVPFHRIAQAI